MPWHEELYAKGMARCSASSWNTVSCGSQSSSICHKLICSANESTKPQQFYLMDESYIGVSRRFSMSVPQLLFLLLAIRDLRKYSVTVYYQV
jgi:hypothetical protein